MSQSEELGLKSRGCQVSRLRRILYERSGEPPSDNGLLEITLGEGNSFVLQPASDGEALAVRAGPWTDPFAPPLSRENDEFVRTHGKWTAFDVSSQEPFRALIGEKVQLVSPILNPRGIMIGMEATTDSAVLRVEVQADDLVLDLVVLGDD